MDDRICAAAAQADRIGDAVSPLLRNIPNVLTAVRILLAPLTACMVLTKICSMPNRSWSGFSAMTRPMVEQLGLVTM